jgi:hypothetical protein
VTEKLERLTEILSVVNVGQCIIFVHMRDTVDQARAAGCPRARADERASTPPRRTSLAK